MDKGFSARFKEVRKIAGLNQKEFGKKLEISLPTVTRIERQDRVPDVGLVLRLCSKFKCDLKWLILGEGIRNGGAEADGGELLLLEKLPADLSNIPGDEVAGRFVIPDVPDGGVVIACRDDAMAPFVKRGDLAIIVPGDCGEGDIVLLRDQWGDGHIRRRRVVDGRPVYMAEDGDFPPLADKGFSCLGTVIKVIRDL